jgi:glycosyltransferase involved in cell wall biosynthesis
MPGGAAASPNGRTCRAACRASPAITSHYQPRAPRDLGHYSLDGTDAMRRQIELARGGGLHGFVFYFYWFNGHRLLDRPVEAFLADPALDFPFCLMWANENWTRRWDGSDEDILIWQDYRAEDEARLIATFGRHFADPRYIRVRGRPLLMIYRPGLIPDAAATIARWRALFREAHGEDPVFVMSQSFDDNDPGRFGMDGAVEFPPHKLVQGLSLKNDKLQYLDPEFSGQVYDYDEVVAGSLEAPEPTFPLIKTVIPGWDNDARRQGAGLIVHGATPAKYQAWLEHVVLKAREQPFFDTPIICINAWNEWAEGAYLEPDVHYGGAFLNATGRALAGLAPPIALGQLLLVGHDAFPAGAQQLLLHIGRRLARMHGLRIEFLLLGGGALEAAYAEVAPVTIARDEPALDRALVRICHEKGVRAAIVNTVATGHLCPRLARCGVACTLLIHELPHLITEKNLLAGARDGAAAAQQVVFAAPYVRDRFAELVPLDPERAMLLPQGSYKDISFSAEARRKLRDQLGLDAAAVLAIGIGYADLRKGFDLFLQVWRAVRRRSRQAHLLWVGDIDPVVRGYLADEIAEAEASGSFHFLGWRNDVADWLSAADVLLLTSREDAFPTVVLEALFAGTPTIAFEKTGGIPDLLRSRDIGKVVKLADVEAMARGVLEIVRAPSDSLARERLVAVARAHYDFGAYAEALLRLAQPSLLRISVAVPSYDYARFLRPRLASIFAQSYPVCEVILLDDASSDDSVAVARQTAAEWGRELRVVVNEANSGSVFRQWRRAAELARGDFLWIAEADDSSDPKFLEKLADAISGAPETVLGFTDSRSIDGAGAPVWSSYGAYYAESAGPDALSRDGVFHASGFARRFLAERNLILNAGSVLWRREALLGALDRCEADLASYRMAGDWRVYLEALTEGDSGSVVYVSEPLNVHRRHALSVTQQLDPERHVEEIRRIHRLAAKRLRAGPELRNRQSAYLRQVAEQLRSQASAAAA